jgi:hypothetical protein
MHSTVSHVCILLLLFAANTGISQTLWNTAGNSAALGDFIGTTNARNLVFKVNNEEGMVLDENWSLSIGQGNVLPAAGLAGHNFVTGSGNVVNDAGGLTYNNLIAGSGNSVSGASSSAIGQANTITHTVFGTNHALGTSIKINSSSLCIGIGTALQVSSGTNRFIMGSGNLNTSAYLANPVDNSLLIGFNAIPTFFVQEGRVGIGTTQPKEAFQIGDRLTFHDGGSKYIGYNATYNGITNVKMVADYSDAIAFSGGGIIFQTGANGAAATSSNLADRLIIHNDGKVEMMNELNVKGRISIGIKPVPPGSSYGLYVDQGILAGRVKVALPSGAEWFDHVFNEDYQLMPLDSLNSYVKANKHLPDIPGAGEVVKEGLDLGRFNALLLKKVEELTLYIIDLQNRVSSGQRKNKRLY